jgi:hypothetical protein
MAQGGSPAGQPFPNSQIRSEFVDTKGDPEPEFDLGRAPPHVDALEVSSRRAVRWVIALLLAAALAAGAYLYWFHFRSAAPSTEPPPAAAQAPAPAPAEPAIKHPIEEARPDAPAAAGAAPALEESDQAVTDALAELVGRDTLARFASLSGFVRRVVATIDNLPRNRAPQRVWPLLPTPGRFAVTGGKEAVYLSAENYGRYEPALRVMESIDTGELVALYVRLYPLFQQAYKDLGYPDKYFNDRLVAVIDHLLATPEGAGPIRLAQPHVLYEFADPALEARSAGQKILIRIGPENGARVKAKLREIRRQVTGKALPQ